MASAYRLPDLGYDYSALEPHLSARTVELHHDKHHAAYVDGANEALEKLAEARETGRLDSINALEKDLAFNVSGHRLHSVFWKNLSPAGGGEPGGGIADAVSSNFGSFEAFKAEFTASASGVQGSGWGALVWEPLGQRLVVQQIVDHQSNVAIAGTPLLVVDMWEHAYYLQYENRKKEWLDAFWALVSWEDVASRLEGVRGEGDR